MQTIPKKRLVPLFVILMSALAGSLTLTSCKPQPPQASPSETSSSASSAPKPAEWLTDFEAAHALAKSTNKLLLLDFTGSDWCPPCKELHKKVFMAPEFEEFAKENLVLLMLDFPEGKPQSESQKRHNQELSEQYKVEGFPTVIVLDGAGKELKREVGYDGSSAKDYVAALQKLKSKP